MHHLTFEHLQFYIIIQHVQETSEMLPLSTVFLQPVELVTTCPLTMLGALEVVRAAYCALYINCQIYIKLRYITDYYLRQV